MEGRSVSKAPSMPVFTDALLGDTTHLSTEEFGAYCLILFVTWRNNAQPLPDDPVRMARICRVSVKRWTDRLRPVLAEFFDLTEGSWRQHRLEKEWRYVQKVSAIRSESGKRGAEAKALKNNKTDEANASAGLKQTASTHTHTHKELTLEADASKATVIAFPLGQDTSPPKPPSQDLNALFSEWWSFVPRKVSKGQAEKAYRAAVKHTDPADLLAGIKRFASECAGKDPQYIAHPSTWLNGKRWLDEPSLPLNGVSHVQRDPVRNARPVSGGRFAAILQRDLATGH